jgi:hypothetical protein
MITSVAVSEVDRLGKIFLLEMIITLQIFACGQGRGEYPLLGERIRAPLARSH